MPLVTHDRPEQPGQDVRPRRPRRCRCRPYWLTLVGTPEDQAKAELVCPRCGRHHGWVPVPRPPDGEPTRNWLLALAEQHEGAVPGPSPPAWRGLPCLPAGDPQSLPRLARRPAAGRGPQSDRPRLAGAGRRAGHPADLAAQALSGADFWLDV
jgi:hypothetical protein